MSAEELHSLLASGHDVFREHVDINGDLDMSHSQILGRASFLDCTWHGKVDFSYTFFQKHVEFHLCVFSEHISFEFAQFASTIEIRGTEFRTDARFNRIKVAGVALFRPYERKDCLQEFREGREPKRTIFHGRATFLQADFGREANFGSVLFEKHADFYNVAVHGPTFYRPDPFKVSKLEGPPVEFLDGVRFRDARFEGELNCYGIQCDGAADFSLMRVAGPAFFSEPDKFDEVFYSTWQKAQRLKPWRANEKQHPSRIAARFSSTVDFSGATFESAARFDGVILDGLLNLTGTNFRRELVLNGQSSGHLKLRGCSYGRIELGKDALQGFVDRIQDHKEPQIWVQLESVLRSMGEDDDADIVYIKRRNEKHKRLQELQKTAKGWDRLWRWGPRFWDGVVKSIGYGTDTKVIFFVPVLIWIGTFLLFWLGPVPVTYALKDSTLYCQPGDGGKFECSVSAEVNRQRWCPGDALAVTVSLISPLPLGVGSKFELNANRTVLCPEDQAKNNCRWNGGPTYAAYGAFLRLLSWIAIPLWLAHWTGLLNQRVRPKFLTEEGGE